MSPFSETNTDQDYNNSDKNNSNGSAGHYNDGRIKRRVVRTLVGFIGAEAA